MASFYDGFAFSGLNLEQFKAKQSGVKNVTSLPMNGNKTGDLLFDTAIGRLYQYSEFHTDIFGSNGTWSVYIPTAAEDSNPAFNYPSAKIAYNDITSGQAGTVTATYTGPADPTGYIEWQYISSSSHNLNFSTLAPNAFIHSGSGQDAIQVATGRNVLDGGTGSNFLVGGDGIDTFFTDARGTGVTWNTLENFHTGDAATLWGYDPGVSRYWWEGISGAQGHQGATLRADIHGSGTVDASITFTGFSLDQASHLQVSSAPSGASPYLYFYNPGV